MLSKRERVTVVMDSGGVLSRAGSNKELFTTHFGGCTAICVQTDSGLYGLYHLRSTLDGRPDMVPTAKDSNEPFREWIKEVIKEANGETIHFKIGTPRGYGMEGFLERHPEVGMERYIRKLCQDIENYDITLMNMVGVDSVAVTEQGLTCYHYREKVSIDQAEYQTDEEIFENSGLTNFQCLNNIRSFPNIDYDGKLLEKYQKRYDLEVLEAQQKEMEALEERQKDRRGMIKSITDPMVITLNNMLERYKAQFDRGSKEDKKALNACCFLEELSKVVEAGDLSALQDMKKLPYFKQVTESDSFMSFFTKESSEIGKLFYKAETLLIHTLEIYPEEISYSPRMVENRGGSS